MVVLLHRKRRGPKCRVHEQSVLIERKIEEECCVSERTVRRVDPVKGGRVQDCTDTILLNLASSTSADKNLKRYTFPRDPAWNRRTPSSKTYTNSRPPTPAGKRTAPLPSGSERRSAPIEPMRRILDNHVAPTDPRWFGLMRSKHRRAAIMRVCLPTCVRVDAIGDCGLRAFGVRY